MIWDRFLYVMGRAAIDRPRGLVTEAARVQAGGHLQALDHGLSFRPSAKDAIEHAHHEWS